MGGLFEPALEKQTFQVEKYGTNTGNYLQRYGGTRGDSLREEQTEAEVAGVYVMAWLTTGKAERVGWG